MPGDSSILFTYLPNFKVIFGLSSWTEIEMLEIIVLGFRALCSKLPL